MSHVTWHMSSYPVHITCLQMRNGCGGCHTNFAKIGNWLACFQEMCHLTLNNQWPLDHISAHVQMTHMIRCSAAGSVLVICLFVVCCCSSEFNGFGISMRFAPWKNIGPDWAIRVASRPCCKLRVLDTLRCLSLRHFTPFMSALLVVASCGWSGGLCQQASLRNVYQSLNGPTMRWQVTRRMSTYPVCGIILNVFAGGPLVLGDVYNKNIGLRFVSVTEQTWPLDHWPYVTWSCQMTHMMSQDCLLFVAVMVYTVIQACPWHLEVFCHHSYSKRIIVEATCDIKQHSRGQGLTGESSWHSSSDSAWLFLLPLHWLRTPQNKNNVAKKMKHYILLLFMPGELGGKRASLMFAHCHTSKISSTQPIYSCQHAAISSDCHCAR